MYIYKEYDFQKKEIYMYIKIYQVTYKIQFSMVTLMIKEKKQITKLQLPFGVV